ncbi:MAG: hypothetical protein ACX93O_12050 [Flagellimonas sp.]
MDGGPIGLYHGMPLLSVDMDTKLKKLFEKTSQGGPHLGEDFYNIKFGGKWRDLTYGDQFYYPIG